MRQYCLFAYLIERQRHLRKYICKARVGAKSFRYLNILNPRPLMSSSQLEHLCRNVESQGRWNISAADGEISWVEDKPGLQRKLPCNGGLSHQTPRTALNRKHQVFRCSSISRRLIHGPWFIKSPHLSFLFCLSGTPLIQTSIKLGSSLVYVGPD